MRTLHPILSAGQEDKCSKRHPRATIKNIAASWISVLPTRQKNMFQFLVQFAFHSFPLTSSSAKHSTALAMLACINYSFTLYLNPGLNGLRSFFSISYLNLKSQLKSFRKAKHLLFRQHWTYIHRCLDLVRSNRRYGTALNSVAYFARSKSRLREWKTFDPEVHALEILFGNLPHQISTINFKLFMCSKLKRK